MQDNNQNFGLSDQDDTMQSRNMAAIALAEAMERARSQQTGREAAKADLQAGAVIKLEALRKKLEPLYAAIPHDVELFDLGLISHEKPRLFVDIIAFIEMNREQTGYRFLQETRAGRVVLAETADEKHMVGVVTDYVARRLIVREHALDAETVLAPVKLHRAVEIGVASTTSTAGSFTHSSVASSTAASLSNSEPELLNHALRAEPKQAEPVQEPAVTAAEAFRQWSPSAANANRAEQESVKPLMAQAMHDIDRKLPPRETVQAHTTAPHVSASIVTAKQELATESLRDNTLGAVAVASLAPTPETLLDTVKAETVDPVLNVQKNAVQSVTRLATPAAALATVAGAAAGAARKTHTFWTPGWWIWPLLALLLGVGLGALMLYVYAANLVR